MELLRGAEAAEAASRLHEVAFARALETSTGFGAPEGGAAEKAARSKRC